MHPYNLPALFNPVEIEAFLSTHTSESNKKACMRVILKLISGEGVSHKAKPGEIFLKNRPVTPSDNIEELRVLASEWLPYNGSDALDKGHGWALNHPLQKLINFKRKLLGVEVTKKGISKRPAKKKNIASLCIHERNEKDHVGECGECGGPTPYCVKCDACYCEWC